MWFCHLTLINLIKRFVLTNRLLITQIKLDEKEHHLLTEQLNKMSSQLEEVRRKKQSIIIHLESIEDILHYYNEFEEAKDSLQTTLDDIDDIQMKLAEYDIYTLVSGLIAEERNQVAILTKKQIEIITREKNIEMVNKQIEDIKQEIESWSAIVDTLNPQDGLIAEGLLGYIKIFLARMNGFYSIYLVLSSYYSSC